MLELPAKLYEDSGLLKSELFDSSSRKASQLRHLFEPVRHLPRSVVQTL